jgi:hypothetical protein
LNGSETIFEEEYIYDSFGNCTENRIYKVTVKGNGKRKERMTEYLRKNISTITITAGNIGLLLCRQTQRSISFLFAYQQRFRLTECI